MPRLTTEHKAAIETRRVQVADLMLAAKSYRQIAEKLNCSLGTVASDAKAIFRRWQSEQKASADSRITIQDLRLEAAVEAIWKKVGKGNLRAVEIFRKLSESQRRLLGLDKPTKVEATGKDGAPLIPPSISEAVARVYGGGNGSIAPGASDEPGDGGSA